MDWGNIQERNADFEARYNFDPHINYKAVIEEYNMLVGVKDYERAAAILKVHGGVIAMIGKYEYQKALLLAGLI